MMIHPASLTAFSAVSSSSENAFSAFKTSFIFSLALWTLNNRSRSIDKSLTKIQMRLLGLLGLTLILLGEGLTFIHVLPWSQYVFPLFWYGYILVLDSLNFRRQGRSLLTHRPQEFLFMLPISALYWYLFEWYNAVIQNWLYINTPPEKWIEIPMKIVSFATVIPALYETAELL